MGRTYAVTRRSGRDTTESNLVQLVPFAVWLPARVEKVWGVREPSSSTVRWVLLSHQSLDDIHDSTEKVRSARNSRRTHRFDDRSFGNVHIDVIVESVVDDTLGIEYS